MYYIDFDGNVINIDLETSEIKPSYIVSPYINVETVNENLEGLSYVGIDDYLIYDNYGNIYCEAYESLNKIVSGNGKNILNIVNKNGKNYVPLDIFVLYDDLSVENIKTVDGYVVVSIVSDNAISMQLYRYSIFGALNNGGHRIIDRQSLLILTTNNEIKVLDINEKPIAEDETVNGTLLTDMEIDLVVRKFFVNDGNIIIVDQDEQIWYYGSEWHFLFYFGYSYNNHDIHIKGNKNLVLVGKHFKSPISDIVCTIQMRFYFLLHNGEVYHPYELCLANSPSWESDVDDESDEEPYAYNDNSESDDDPKKFNPVKFPFGEPIEQIYQSRNGCVAKTFGGKILEASRFVWPEMSIRDVVDKNVLTLQNRNVADRKFKLTKRAQQ